MRSEYELRVAANDLDVVIEHVLNSGRAKDPEFANTVFMYGVMLWALGDRVNAALNCERVLEHYHILADAIRAKRKAAGN